MSAGLQLTEAAVRELVARLNANLAGAIAIVNADPPAPTDDTYVIEAPAEVFDFVPPPSRLVQFPTVGIQHGLGTLEDDQGWSATGVHELTVVSFLQTSEPDALARRLRRYAQAVARVALAGRNLGAAAWGTTLVGVDYGPTLGERENSRVYMSWVAVTIRAKLDEE